MLLAVRVFMMQVTVLMFRKLAHGGSDRGVNWPKFANQYVRKDGTEVPAWGGVPKVRGEGSVKGKLRPSGKRVTSSSLLMQDTGRLRSERLNLQRLTPSSIQFGPTAAYAGAQHKLRPWSFFTPKEIEKSADAAFRVYTRHLDKS